MNNNMNNNTDEININNEPSNNNIEKCKKIMVKSPPIMKMFSIPEIIGSSAVMYVPWMIVLFITFIIMII